MQAILSAIFLAFSFFLRIQATPLDDYVWKYDENYKWVDMVSPRLFLVASDVFLTGAIIFACFFFVGK